ncbi:type II toxin-antitoxin system RelE/ParE family toxin [Colwelliaceae bacterium BS250]
MYNIVATPTFVLSLQRLSYFLSKKYSATVAKETKTTIKLAIDNKLKVNPFAVPISQRLIDLGIKEYRQLVVDKHNLIFFSVNERTNTVILLAVIDSRQSISKLLYEVSLMR